MESNETQIQIVGNISPNSLLFFQDSSGNPIGKLYPKDGKIVFEGNAEESALKFFDYFIKYIEVYSYKKSEKAVNQFKDRLICEIQGMILMGLPEVKNARSEGYNDALGLIIEKLK